MWRCAAIAAIGLLGACAVRAQPYRFASPMVAGADVPDASRSPRSTRSSSTPRPPRTARGVAQRDPLPPEDRPPPVHHTAATITIVSATPPAAAIASGAAAAEVVDEPNAHGAVISRLPSPHRVPSDAPMPAVHSPEDLRALVGRRDRRAPAVAALAWSAALGHTVDAATGPELASWAESANRLAAASTLASPGDLLIFDHTDGPDAADLIAVVIARDARGVTEYLYLGGGVVRRGFVDVSRRARRRDADGTVVNTYLRTGRRWPPPGTHYLAGELLAHVVQL